MSPDSRLVDVVHASPNHGPRRAPAPDALILHYTGMATPEAALRRLCDPVAEVSAHYFVWEDGRIAQLVPEARRAWHAGRSAWAGETDMNSASIGIEIVNAGHEGGLPPYPAAQIEALVALCADICARRAIPRRRVLAHSDIAPGRKIDPGELFPWDQLALGGIGHYVPPRPIVDGPLLARGDAGDTIAEVQAMLAAYGYEVPTRGTFDMATEVVIGAFQRHFRPARVDGIADVSTVETLRDLMR